MVKRKPIEFPLFSEKELYREFKEKKGKLKIPKLYIKELEKLFAQQYKVTFITKINARKGNYLWNPENVYVVKGKWNDEIESQYYQALRAEAEQESDDLYLETFDFTLTVIDIEEI